VFVRAPTFPAATCVAAFPVNSRASSTKGLGLFCFVSVSTIARVLTSYELLAEPSVGSNPSAVS
jgi:hypothetical protein